MESKESLKALEKLMELKSEDIIPEIDLRSGTGYHYPAADELLETSSGETIKTLERMAKQNLLAKFPYDKLMACPSCKSFDLRTTTSCPHCNHFNLRRGRVLEHITCGYVGSESEFISADGYTCPKCRRELKLVGADYRSPGVMYKCESCGKVSRTPRERFVCQSCNQHSTLDELNEHTVNGYRISAQGRSKGITIERPKAKLMEWFKARGYEVSTPARVVGKSNVRHKVDMLAEKYSKGGFLADRVFIDFHLGENEATPDPILALFAKGMDTDNSRLMLIVVPKLNKNAQLFAKMYNIEVFEGTTLEEAVVKFFAQAPDASKWLLGR